MPPRAAYRKRVSRLAAPKFRERKSPKDTMGAGERASTIRKAARAQRPKTALSFTARPPREASIRAKVTAPNPSVASTAPGQSRRPLASGLRLSGTRHRVMHTTAAAIGRLIRKTQRQEACSIIHPPSTGPSAAVIEVKPDQVPIASPRSFSENDALISARLPGTRRAAPAPCTPRAMISHETDEASPQAADANANSTTPRVKI